MSRKKEALTRAKIVKNDEFYTPLNVIQEELSLYPVELFKDKIVYCNCDNPYKSQFISYFKDNFKRLELKRLRATCYDKDWSLFTGESKALHYEYDGENETVTHLEGNGSFESEECLEILNNSDIVVTNPPFSLAKKFMSILVESKKDFIILGHTLWTSKRQIFIDFLNGDIKLGYGNNKAIQFVTPNEPKSVNCTWYTSFSLSKDIPFLKLTESYSPERYKRFKKYPEVINVDRVKKIPYDWDGIMGVPVTFLKYWNPE